MKYGGIESTRKGNWWNERSTQLVEARKLRSPQGAKVETSNL